MSFDGIFEFLESKDIPRGTFQTRDRCNICPPPSIIINLSFFKNAINSKPLGNRDQYFQDFHVSMIPTTGKNFKKSHEVRVICTG